VSLPPSRSKHSSPFFFALAERAWRSGAIAQHGSNAPYEPTLSANSSVSAVHRQLDLLNRHTKPLNAEGDESAAYPIRSPTAHCAHPLILRVSASQRYWPWARRRD
jgi:hypothetical protein